MNVHCSRFWLVVENSRSYIVHASGTTCSKSLKTAKKVVQGSSKNHDRKLFTLLVGRQKFTCVHCSRFWDHMFKIVQNRQKSCPGSSKNYDRKLFTLLAGRQKFTSVHCSRFWDHMSKIAQNRQKCGPGS